MLILSASVVGFLVGSGAAHLSDERKTLILLQLINVFAIIFLTEIISGYGKKIGVGRNFMALIEATTLVALLAFLFVAYISDSGLGTQALDFVKISLVDSITIMGTLATLWVVVTQGLVGVEVAKKAEWRVLVASALDVSVEFKVLLQGDLARVDPGRYRELWQKVLRLEQLLIVKAGPGSDDLQLASKLRQEIISVGGGPILPETAKNWAAGMDIILGRLSSV